MAEQLDIFGVASAVPTDRLFFGIYPPAAVAERIEVLARRLREREGLRGKIHQADRFHITLFHVGDFAGVPADLLAKCEVAAAALRFAPFEVAFDSAQSFSSQPRNRPFTLRGTDGVAILIEMRQALATEMMKVGLAREARTGFTPHVTLLYDDHAVDEIEVPPVSWRVESFVLVRSHLGQTRHDPLRTWFLKA